MKIGNFTNIPGRSTIHRISFISMALVLYVLAGTVTVSNAQQGGVTSSEELEKQLAAPVRTRSLGGGQGFNGNAGRASLGAIQFEYNSTDLTPAGRAQVEELAKAIQNLGSQNFRIVGHTDASGSEQYNMTLSQRRARAVVKLLTSKYGIDEERLTSDGLGESNLLEKGDPNSPKNRRVEVINAQMLQ